MTLINLTPHEINLVSESGAVHILRGADTPARVSENRVKVGNITILGDTFLVNAVSLGEVTGVPDPQNRVCYIVSRVVAEALRDRTDLFIVDETIRNEKGQVVGARALAQIGDVNEHIG